ncbi:regulatory protein, luxR family [Promicromonospora umidemergens]|uniref:HTH luxR-type domain-containing protein n=1 Tax=Promicromonospora umidemergens TaxID=629679 RepID=A0ABP8XH02_9MICO|nr:response regulator transcription factor [Promicromonospora umidemergens]MCP2283008.1 regulatory protein, luxR family [Promicromonospora umidemergens]
MPPWSRLLRAPNRPVAFTVVFWVIVGALVIGAIVGAPAAGTARLVAVAVHIVAVVVLWAWLPWDGSGQGRWVAPAFLVAVALLGFTATAGWHFLLLVVAVAALGRAHRLSVAVWIVAGFVGTLGAVQMAFTPDEPQRALVEMAVVALGATIGLGLTGAPYADAVGPADPGLDLGPQSVAEPQVATEPQVAAEPQVVAGGERQVGPSGFHGVALLTRRERDVVALVGEGRTNREIAGMLYITEGTVKNHVSSALRKLELRDRTQLALRAVFLTAE